MRLVAITSFGLVLPNSSANIKKEYDTTRGKLVFEANVTAGFLPPASDLHVQVERVKAKSLAQKPSEARTTQRARAPKTLGVFASAASAPASPIFQVSIKPELVDRPGAFSSTLYSSSDQQRTALHTIGK